MALKRWSTFIAWDGILPLAVASSLDLIALFLGRANGAAELLAIIFVPIFAALLRCAAGINQLRAMGIRRPGVSRQILLAAAITVLMLFEGVANAIRAIRDIPNIATLIAVAFYATYLLLIWLTFRAPNNAPTRIA